jgi:hypothetical protein
VRDREALAQCRARLVELAQEDVAAADVVLRDREIVEVLEAALDLDRFELVAERVQWG